MRPPQSTYTAPPMGPPTANYGSGYPQAAYTAASGSGTSYSYSGGGRGGYGGRKGDCDARPFSGRGGHGGPSGGGRGRGDCGDKSKNDLDNLMLPKQDFKNLVPFEKNFYVEGPEVQAMSEQEVTTYRARREITVEGRDVPKPVRFFHKANFPEFCLQVIAREDTPRKDTPRLLALLKEMKDGLDVVKSKVEALTIKVKQDKLLTSEGISYLEAKHLLLLDYCQSIVYYLLRKAKGLSIEGHPVVRNLVEIRLFLEKIRPIDKKLEYQIQKLTKVVEGGPAPEKIVASNKELGKSQKEEDPLKFRPNPEMLVSRTAPEEGGGGVYRPPKFAPTIMDDDDKISKKEKQALRRDKAMVRQAKQSSFVNELMANFEDRPEEVRETVGAESIELTRYLAKREAKERQEEELFTRAPVTRREKKLEKHMTKSRNGLLGLTDGFFDDVKMLPLEERETDGPIEHSTPKRGGKRNKKRKAQF